MNTDYVSIFTHHIRQHALRYFPGLMKEPIDVQLKSSQERPSATLYRFHVKDASQVCSVIVKVPARNVLKGRVNDLGFAKPLLFPKAEEAEMHSLQYSALVAIDEYFTSLNRKELGTIRVLDYLPDSQAVVMEESRDPRLQDLLLKESRLRSPFGQYRLMPAFQNVGKWLRIYHKMPKQAEVQVRHEHREDYLEGISKLTDFLAGRLGDRPFFNQITLILAGKGREILPETLPLGLGHGDYAPRNILVGPNARVTVLDTFAKWRTPIYEDIGYFLTGMKMTYPQVISQGLVFSEGQIKAYEQAFLKGYFEQKPVPYPAIKLYEMLTLLDKWSSVLISSYRRSAGFRAAGDLKAAVVSLYFRRRTKQLLNEIAGVKRAAASLGAERSY